MLLAIFSIEVAAQSNELKGYRIDGDEVVFRFDKRAYENATKNDNGQAIDFQELNISNVTVSGEFNNWSLHKWHMTKIDENIFELRKKISDFTDEYTWEFKFVINNEFWAEPFESDINSVEATKNGHPLYTYNLKFYSAAIDDNGNATFKLDGYESANNVVLAGSFNKWDENVFKMKQVNGSWLLTLKLKPGVYEYKFIVDGDWMHDPNNPLKNKNEFDGYNSVIDITKKVSFILQGHHHANQVILAGSFNNWSENSYKMSKSKKGWIYTLNLPYGKHHYKFIVDNEWIVDPENSVLEYDNDGHINSVCIVK